MAYFCVRLDRTVFEHSMVYVEAETEAQAKELAIEEALTGESVEWRWKDTLDEADVFDIEQISEAEWREVDGRTSRHGFPDRERRCRWHRQP
jgi:hypothetical protein